MSNINTQSFLNTDEDKQQYYNNFYKLINYIKENKDSIANFAQFLPLVFSLHGKPYTLRGFEVFEPYFNLNLPRFMTWKTGRQVSKSTSSAAHSIILGLLRPYYNILQIFPFQEQMRKFSATVLQPFVNESPVKDWIVERRSTRIEQTSLSSGTNLFFSFASNDCSRIRGIPASSIHYDEIQDISPEFIPEINSCASAETNPVFTFTGTPKTLDNIIEHNWQESSQAEWCICCSHCGKINVPALKYDLEAMIGPKVPMWDVSPDMPGLVCSKCRKWLYTSNGRWIHQYPERRFTHVGYHVPQCIMPAHNMSSTKWQDLLNRKEGAEHFTYAKWLNECMGESFDQGQKLITITDLKNVSILPSRRYVDDVIKWVRTRGYVSLVMGVDWAGFSSTTSSFTKVAIVGMLPNGVIEVPYGWKSLTPVAQGVEAHRLKQLYDLFHVQAIVHDFCGQGANREIDLRDLGLDAAHIIPVLYQGMNTGPLIKKVHDSDPARTIQDYYALQKARSLTLLCSTIRAKKVLFFQYDYISPEQPGLLHDFLGLMEETVDNPSGKNGYRVVKSARTVSDDFVHAVNYATMILYYKHQMFPSLLNRDFTDPNSHADLLKDKTVFDDEALIRGKKE